MTGKEALQELKKLIPFKEELTDKVLECENIIERDLERLKQLEYVMLLIVDYGLIDTERLEDVMYCEELEAIQKACNDAEDRSRNRGFYEDN